MLAELAHVDVSDRRSQGPLNGLRRIEWEPQLSRESVAGPSWNDSERWRNRTRFIALDEGARHLVDCAVAAPRHHELGARGSRVEREIVRVTGTFGDTNIGRHAEPVERAFRNVYPL